MPADPDNKTAQNCANLKAPGNPADITGQEAPAYSEGQRTVENTASGRKRKAWYITASGLSACGKDDMPEEMISSKHLIYSSPATLAFNSPGAQGFGVKRAGLAIPGSVMLLVSPGCCGRNTTILSSIGGYSDRFFYLLMDSTDIVTGRHLKRIPDAVQEVYDSLDKKPSVVMICITCVDALLGTDMERVCRKASQKTGIPVLPCYMYALTREGRRPPMVHVRQSIYSLLRPQKRVSTTVNILGYFAPLEDDCELYEILQGLGVKKINEISRLRSIDEYYEMSQANFNLVLNSEALPAADDMRRKLGLPYIELRRLYRMPQIQKQYELFISALGGEDISGTYRKQAEDALAQFRDRFGGVRFAVGEGCNANAFELSLFLLESGFRVPEIFASVNAEDFVYIDRIARISPDTRIYSNLEPTMIYYGSDSPDVDICIGKDAVYYHPEAAHEEWSSDVQPFGFSGVKHFFTACAEALEKKKTADSGTGVPDIYHNEVFKEKTGSDHAEETDIKGLRLKIPPFAPDQSGAAAVLCDMGGLTVIVDAGGCAGNICGFDEPRWFSSKSAIFSAGLRDMDAILGRDDKLIQKVCDASEKIDGKFTALIGTPVPAVIATDYRALAGIIRKKTGKPVISAYCDGTKLYDKGASEAFLGLMKEYAGRSSDIDAYCGEPSDSEAGRSPDEPVSGTWNNAGHKTAGILGATPLDVGNIDMKKLLIPYFKRRGFSRVFCYGMGSGTEEAAHAGESSVNIVISPSGLAAARYLKETFGTPYEEDYPPEIIPGLDEIMTAASEKEVHKILIVHEQMLANALRRYIREQSSDDVIIRAGTWFELDEEFSEKDDIAFRSETQFSDECLSGGYDLIIGDPVFRRAVGGYTGRYADLPHFAVSGGYQEADGL